ncbi:glycosyltransferase family 4 protein [Patescibacteria group bacterium]|nr:glycosyltransferase family 4 protein [Patescibacteria group bacterium]
MIKVGFDISQIAFGGGVSVYTENLARALCQQKTLEMIYFYSSLRKPYTGQLPNVKNYKIPPSVTELLFNKLHRLPVETLLGSIDIFHSSDWIQPPSYAKKVTTYHDLVPILYPQWSHPKIVKVHKRRLELVEKEIDLVITVSESTKRDLLKVSQIAAEKIVVIYEAVEEFFKPCSREQITAFRKKYHLPKEFVLAMGGVGERKNLARIKKAVGKLPLMLTGDNLPKLDRRELPLLYGSAEALVYTPLYEGFGLPILEAFACGCPVVTSNISSMPEVAKNAAVLVDPLHESEIQKGLHQALASKQKLVKLGLQRAKDFSWSKTALQTVQAYQKVMKSPS